MAGKKKKENQSGNYDKTIHTTWLVPILLDKAKLLNLPDLKMSKSSLEIFVATCLSLGIWNLLPKTKLHWSHNPRAPTLTSAEVWLVRGHVLKKESGRASLVVQWLRIYLLMQGTPVWSPLWENPTFCGKILHAQGQLSPCAYLLKPTWPRACAPPREATAKRSPRTETGE